MFNSKKIVCIQHFGFAFSNNSNATLIATSKIQHIVMLH
ncbi:hypothetical protein SAMN05216262_12811 [Colwellia chukchiensis]|uniref:Uncharacterized protein n=2 Tax=Colwelliaceae TaxID=267889 RepID=A0A7X0TSE0_9GAMM|nr:hypothetical protein [Thalassotalea piscium]SEL87301.1 hypothetical protein SAMN05216262_12811 [Colwellia chukchiensis]